MIDARVLRLVIEDSTPYPLTYVVDTLRTSMLAGSASSFGPSHDYAVILLTTIVLVFIGARLYPHLAT